MLSLKNLAKQVKKETKESSRTFEELFIASVDQFIVDKEVKKGEREKRKAHNPSGFYKCQRMQWYELNDFPKKIRPRGARLYRVLDIGTITHEWIQEQILMVMDKEPKSPIRLIPKEELPVFGKEGIEFITEHHAPPMEVKFLDHRFTKLFPISAMVDGALVFATKNTIFEFKTMNTKDFQLLIEVPMDYRKQGALYSMSLEVNNVLFLFIDKDTQEFKAYLVEYGEPQHEWVRSRIQGLEGYVERKELPPKEVSDNCRWCPFKGACDNEVSELTKKG